MKRRKFPVLGLIILIYGVVWLLSDLKIVNIDVPWWPLILIIVGTGMVFNRLVL